MLTVTSRGHWYTRTEATIAKITPTDLSLESEQHIENQQQERETEGSRGPSLTQLVSFCFSERPCFKKTKVEWTGRMTKGITVVATNPADPFPGPHSSREPTCTSCPLTSICILQVLYAHAYTHTQRETHTTNKTNKPLTKLIKERENAN